MSEWKNIDDAPIDRPILVQCNNFGERIKGVHFAVVQWDDEYGVWADANFDPDEEVDLEQHCAYHHATHWMELPKPAAE